jgi:hypothetical protein
MKILLGDFNAKVSREDIVTNSQGSIHDGTLLHSKIQYTTLDYSSQLF